MVETTFEEKKGSGEKLRQETVVNLPADSMTKGGDLEKE